MTWKITKDEIFYIILLIIILNVGQQKQPVWEITGAEFTNQGVHTADGISIRFPRVTRIRHDKDWSTATSLNELRGLFKKKPDSVDFSHLLGTLADVEDIPRKRSPNPATSPRKFEKKARKITSSLDEPSTSFKIEDVSEESFERRKRDKCDEEPDSIADIQPRSKKLKVSKIETEATVKRDVGSDSEEKTERNRDVDCYLTSGTNAEGSSKFSSVLDAKDEDNVSRRYFYSSYMIIEIYLLTVEICKCYICTFFILLF